MGGGAILGGLVMGAIAAFVLDRQLTKAAAFAAVGGALTFFGFMHGEAVGIGQSPLVAASYLVVAGILLACARSTTAERPPVPEHAAPAPGAAD
jgi:AGZA family xanthine/uracil permease-like MFS transporter